MRVPAAFSRRGLAVTLTVGALLAGLALVSRSPAQRGTASGNAASQRAEQAPAFSLPLLREPGSLSLAGLRGHVVVLNFWASWCSACRKEAPELTALWRTFDADGVRFVGVDDADGRSPGLRFARAAGFGYTLLSDGSGDVAARYGLVGLPDTFIIDSIGRIRYRVIGDLNPGSLRSALESVLRGSDSSSTADHAAALGSTQTQLSEPVPTPSEGEI